jgi:hypothetical protein
MTTAGFLAELRRRDRLLFAVALAHVAALVAFLVVLPFDSRIVTGLNPWIKPIKFAASIAIYTATLGWLLPHVRDARRAKDFIRWGVAIVMPIEMACIALQAARGTASHFNFHAPLEAVVFGLMGLGIMLHTVLLALLFLLCLTRPGWIAPPYLWGIRLGLLVIVLGSLEGALMIVRGGHTVGAADGGPGLPLVDWSTRAGDLRIAHALGLHALQAFPLFGWAVSGRVGPRVGTRLVFFFAVVWTGVAAWLFAQAMAGRPLLT